MPSCSQTCRRRPLHPPLPLQSANSPYHFCDRTYSIFPISTILFPDTLFRSSHTSPPLVRSRYTPANERKRFTPSPFSTSRGVSPPPPHPSSGSKLLSLLCFFSSMRHHPNDFSLSPTRTAEGRILSSVSSPAEFLTSKPAQPRRTVPVPFSHSLCSLCVSFFSLLFPKISRRRLAASISAATQTQPKPLIKRQHPYQLPDKPQRQPSEAVNPFLKILIKASEPLFSASPQSSGSAARASPAPPASSSHRSGFPPRSAARPSAWPVLPLHRSK